MWLCSSTSINLILLMYLYLYVTANVYVYSLFQVTRCLLCWHCFDSLKVECLAHIHVSQNYFEVFDFSTSKAFLVISSVLSPHARLHFHVVLLPEQKKEVYDLYGKDGLSGSGSSFTAGSARFDPFFSTAHHRFAHFRDPFDVFREFFGGRDPFADFAGQFLLLDAFICNLNANNDASFCKVLGKG
jgi:hypothetical protein